MRNRNTAISYVSIYYLEGFLELVIPCLFFSFSSDGINEGIESPVTICSGSLDLPDSLPETGQTPVSTVCVMMQYFFLLYKGMNPCFRSASPGHPFMHRRSGLRPIGHHSVPATPWALLCAVRRGGWPQEGNAKPQKEGDLICPLPARATVPKVHSYDKSTPIMK